MVTCRWFVTFTAWCVLIMADSSRAFLPLHVERSNFLSTHTNIKKHSTTTSSRRSVFGNGDGDGADWLENLKNLWGGNPQQNQNKQEKNDSEGPAGSSRIATIPVESIKLGGLRLFLMFYCMGMQNTPGRNSWRADQPSKDEYVVEMLFHDNTGMLILELSEDEIRIDRLGSSPSTQYLMQESVVVEGILDELSVCASDESVAEVDRLLIPNPRDAIDVARSSLSFG